MPRRKFTIRKMRLSDFKHFLLTEQEDLFGDEEAGGDEEPAGEEGGDEDAGAEDDAGGEEGGDAGGGGGGGDEGGEEGGEEGGGEEAEEAEDPNTEVEPVEATGPEDDAVDTELNALLMDFEAEALQTAINQEPLYEPADAAVEAAPAEEEDPMAMENMIRGRISNFLFEQEGDVVAEEPPNIDVDTYAGNVARLIQNYQSLLDMEGLIFDKAKNFLVDKYGEEVAAEFEEVLDIRHGFSMEPKEEPADQYAVGAAGGAAVGE